MDGGMVLGGGVTGLAAGWASGWPVYEARSAAGGICASYYMEAGGDRRYTERPAGGDTYRFEIGGGHWIFGGDPAIRRFIARLVPLRTYRRHSAVYFPEAGRYVPYPLQNHLHHLGEDRAAQALADLVGASERPVRTMADWLRRHFGTSLMDLFFAPFHEHYTAGLWTEIAPQDAYKSPVDPQAVVRGAFGQAEETGYNVTFRYPDGGLDTLMRRLAAPCQITYGKRARHIAPERKEVTFADGSQRRYETLLATLPLNVVMEMTGLSVEERPDPHTSVLVLNVGAVRGAQCPNQHWVYVPRSDAGFHRVGFYSNVDAHFLPASSRTAQDRVSIYVERAYPGDEKPSDDEQAAYARAVVRELKRWGYIAEAEVVDPTWIDVAYTWAWPGSDWRQKALRRLREHDILMVGRYARWTFQGIADSLRDGLFVGASVTSPSPQRAKAP